jgi:hypothetical protein
MSTRSNSVDLRASVRDMFRAQVLRQVPPEKQDMETEKAKIANVSARVAP